MLLSCDQPTWSGDGENPYGKHTHDVYYSTHIPGLRHTVEKAIRAEIDNVAHSLKGGIALYHAHEDTTPSTSASKCMPKSYSADFTKLKQDKTSANSLRGIKWMEAKEGSTWRGLQSVSVLQACDSLR